MEQFSSEKKWRFPDNGHLRIYGFDTPDMETFKRDPIAHFAREICQNSIDARRKGISDPVRIEFELFDIHCSRIPGYIDLKSEINRVRNYKLSLDNEAEKRTAQSVYKSIVGNNLGHIRCLRVSDFNTTGLYGASTHDIRQPFYSLAFGTGSSEKPTGSAGSKGIGKYAAFVISDTNTVFYSTHAIYPEKGNTEDAFIGISKLCSRPLDPDDENFATLGEGCYGVSEKNYPIMEQLKLDSGFNRKDGEFGTDLFIIGFSDKGDWKYEILKKALDSFIVAIIKGLLEIKVDDIELNRNTLPQFIEQLKNQPYISVADKKIIAQYDIFSNLEDESVKKKNVQIKGCEISFYAKVYNKDENRFATNKCSRIRFPYMKIDDVSINSYANASVVCIIEKNYINDILRETENPQHTEWQKNRFKNTEPEKYKEVTEILDGLSTELNCFVTEIISTNISESTDLEGAGEYLPGEDDGDNEGGEGKVPSEDDVTIVATPRRRKPEVRGNNANEDDGNPDRVHSLGEQKDDGDVTGTDVPGKEKDGHGGKNPAPHIDPEDIEIYGKEFKPFLKQIISKSIKFRCFKPSEDDTYNIVFLADSTYDNCELKLSSVGDSNDTEKIAIESATINGADVEVKCGRIVHEKFEEGKKYIVSCRINRKDVFASKVIMSTYNSGGKSDADKE